MPPTEEDEMEKESESRIETDELEATDGEPLATDLEAPVKGKPVVEPRGGDRLPVEPREVS